MAAAGGLDQVRRDRVVRAEHLAATSHGVLAQRAGRLGLAQLEQCVCQGGRRPQRGRMAWAEHSTTAPQRVFAQGAGWRRLSQPN
jgi:hypothetical protein